jgi:prophage antirepressor-like protein
MNNMKIETWCGYDIRFIEINGEWWAILKDICDALDLKTWKVSQRLSPDMLEKIRVEVSDRHSRYITCDPGSTGASSRARKTQDMLAVNELGIYEALFASRRLEARKFRRWSASVMQKLRSRVGLAGYEVMRMTDKDIQDDIDHILDTLFWDEEKKCVMQSVTVQGGDVEQIPFE